MQYERVEQQSPMMEHLPEDVNREELLLKLYDSAIRNVNQAMEEIDSGKVAAEELTCLGKAYWIVEHFIASLDYEQAPELCSDLEGLYHSMMGYMSEAYNTMKSEPLIPVVKALEELRETWREAIQIASGEAVALQA